MPKFHCQDLLGVVTITLFRIIADLDMPDSGMVLSGGEDITALSAIKLPVNTVFLRYVLLWYAL